MADGDDLDKNQQKFTEWYTNEKQNVNNWFDEIKGSNTCGCQKPTSPPSDQQDATRFALRFHNGDKWRFECNNQPGFALCQKDLGRFPP